MNIIDYICRALAFRALLALDDRQDGGRRVTRFRAGFAVTVVRREALLP